MNNVSEFFINLLGSRKSSEEVIVDNVFVYEANEIYYKELALQSAISLIANSISKCEIRVYKNNEEVKDEYYYKLNYQPNPNENGSQFWNKAISKMIYNGECIIVNHNGNLYIADGYNVTENSLKGDIYSDISIGTASINKIIPRNQIIKLKLNNRNVKALIDSLYQQYGDLISYAITNYKNNNADKYKLRVENLKIGDKEHNEIVMKQATDSLKTFMENDKAVFVEHKGQELTKFNNEKNVSSEDFRNLREDMLKIVGQALNIPIELLFGTSTNNLQSIIKQYLTFSIDPLADMMSEEITNGIFGGYSNFSCGNYIKVDTSSLMHIDILEVANAIDKLLSSGSCSPNEIRELIGFNVLDEDWANKHYITKNYSEANLLNEEGEEGGDKTNE